MGDVTNMAEQSDYRIRPAGRHLATIGRDLIQSQYAAIVELVKNSYDADSKDVEIIFRVSEDRKKFTIIVEDHGHGMSRNVVINSWLVPSTDDKLKRRVSPKGRLMQGRKGIGRYATAILGKDLLLQTITKTGEKTEVFLEWSRFEEEEYLEDVPILVETEKTNLPSGTKLVITATLTHLTEWDKTQINNLKYELRKLTPPTDFNFSKEIKDEKFSIFLFFDNFYEDEELNGREEIKPYPLVELFDYKISGKLGDDGVGVFFYTNQRARNTINETIPVNLGRSTGCGELVIDIRIYDREAAAIEQLIGRGLKDEDGNYVGKRQARALLNQFNGIGVYRNGFRIRPLGDPDFDWLKLNEQRVQNPSKKIGSNQVIGYVQIQSEEISGLEETSARDGLKDGKAYEQLKEVTKYILAKLEDRRFIYRQKAGLSRVALKIERDLEKLFTFDDLKKSIYSRLVKIGINEKDANEIIEVINEKEKESNQAVESIREAVAIYQGQATLGKIINVVLHEGRKPLSFFKNQIPNLEFWANDLKNKFNQSALDEVLSISEGFQINADLFSDLFSRLDPLAAKKRGSQKDFSLSKVLKNTFLVFEGEMVQKKISYKIHCDENLTFVGWEQDIFVIMTNLIDNSIFWMVEKDSPVKEIEIMVSNNQNELAYIDYKDTGPGIENHLIESEVIFEPEFTTKNQGTGLGLAIAGEAATRNGLDLKAFISYSGAYFRLQPK